MDDLPPPPPYSSCDPLTPTTSSSESSDTHNMVTLPIRTSLRGGYMRPVNDAPIEEALSSAAEYFEERSFNQSLPGELITHSPRMTAHTVREDLPLPESIKSRNVNDQDWATFLNYLFSALYGNPEGRPDASKKDVTFERAQELLENFSAVLAEWNEGFFGPRRIRLVPELSSNPLSSSTRNSINVTSQPPAQSNPEAALGDPISHLSPQQQHIMHAQQMHEGRHRHQPHDHSSDARQVRHAQRVSEGLAACKRDEIPDKDTKSGVVTNPGHYHGHHERHFVVGPKNHHHYGPLGSEHHNSGFAGGAEPWGVGLWHVNSGGPGLWHGAGAGAGLGSWRRGGIGPWDRGGAEAWGRGRAPGRYPNIPGHPHDDFRGGFHQGDRYDHGRGHRHRRSSSTSSSSSSSSSNSSSSSSSDSSIDSLSSNDLEGADLIDVRRSLAAFRIDPTNKRHVNTAVRQLFADLRSRRKTNSNTSRRDRRNQTREERDEYRAQKRAIRSETRALVKEARGICRDEKRERRAIRKQRKSEARKQKRATRTERRQRKRNGGRNERRSHDNHHRFVDASGSYHDGTHHYPRGQSHGVTSNQEPSNDRAREMAEDEARLAAKQAQEQNWLHGAAREPYQQSQVIDDHDVPAKANETLEECLERQVKEHELQLERDAEQREREAERREDELERAAEQREREAERREKELARAAEQREREAEQRERELERHVEARKRTLDDAALQRENSQSSMVSQQAKAEAQRLEGEAQRLKGLAKAEEQRQKVEERRMKALRKAEEQRRKVYEKAEERRRKTQGAGSRAHGGDFGEGSSRVVSRLEGPGPGGEGVGERGGYGPRIERWGEDFGRNMERWGEDFGRNMEEWGRRQERRWS